MTALSSELNRDLIAAIAVGPAELTKLLVGIALSLPGVTAITLLAQNPRQPYTRRIATSDPDLFPENETEEMCDGSWHRRIFLKKIPVIANTPDEMAQFYPEASDLISLGFGAAISSPVIVNGEVRGIINMLGESKMLTSSLLSRIEHCIPISALVLALSETNER